MQEQILMAYADARYIWTAYHIGKSCKKLVENQELADTIELEKFIIRSAFSMLFKFSSKFQTQRLLDLFKESMFDIPDESGGDDEDDLPPLKRVLKLFSTRKECRFLFEVRSDADP